MTFKVHCEEKAEETKAMLAQGPRPQGREAPRGRGKAQARDLW